MSQIHFNGINGDTGSYLFPPTTTESLVAIATEKQFGNLSDNTDLTRKANQDSSFAPSADVDDSRNLAQTGWGVIFPHNFDPDIRTALQELLDHRRQQAGEYYQEYFGHRGFRPKDTKLEFLGRHQVGFGPVDPKKMPYYLLIVGDPQTIPFSFQQELSVQFAVGRIYFDWLEGERKEDYLKKYAQYASSVVIAETTDLSLPRRVSFFGVENPDDQATKSSTENLIKPLAAWMPDSVKRSNWQVDPPILGERATKARLEKLLGGDETPTLLFTGSHGLGFNYEHSRQLQYQGALVCQDWPGPKDWNGAIPDDFFLAADDIRDDARLLGLIAFNFACYSAGTPQYNEFSFKTNQLASNIKPNLGEKIAEKAFVARLPQRLLSHPQGSALAVIGHVERAWTTSFMWQKIDQTEVFKSTLEELVKGDPIGLAFEKRFSYRHAEISVSLGKLFADIQHGRIIGFGEYEIDPEHLVSLWTANNDARNYIILGDPAVRLMGGTTKEIATERPTIEKVNLDLTVHNDSPKVVSETDELLQAQTSLNQALDKLIANQQDPEQLKIAMSETLKLLQVLHNLI